VDVRRVASGLVGAEGAATVAAGLTFVVLAFVRHPSDRGVAVFLGVLLTAYGVGVLLVSRGLWRAARWARTPALLVQFFGLVVAWYQRSTLPAVAAVVAVVAVAAAAAVLRAVRG
jgi:hypothetical protein